MRKGGKAEKWAARNERLSAALRENLKRRKAQARGRAAPEPAGEEAAPRGLDGGADNPDFRRNRGSD
jgi:hypothetical protein